MVTNPRHRGLPYCMRMPTPCLLFIMSAACRSWPPPWHSWQNSHRTLFDKTQWRPHMEMHGSRLLSLKQELVWQALNDPDVLKLCVPGCESIEATGENAYKLVSQIKIGPVSRSEEHTSELQSLMRISYAVFCLKKKNKYKYN